MSVFLIINTKYKTTTLLNWKTGKIKDQYKVTVEKIIIKEIVLRKYTIFEG